MRVLILTILLCFLGSPQLFAQTQTSSSSRTETLDLKGNPRKPPPERPTEEKQEHNLGHETERKALSPVTKTEKRETIKKDNTQKEKPPLASHNGKAEPGEIIILTDSGEAARIEKLAQEKSYNLLRKHKLTSLGNVLLILRVEDGNVSTVIRELQKLFPGAKIDRNHYYFPSGTPRIYGPDKINWSSDPKCIGKTKGVSVGLIDGEIDQSHPAFKKQRIVQKNFLATGKPDRNHGTAIASILVGNAEDKGFQGILPGSKLYAATVLRTLPRGDEAASAESVTMAMDWLLKNKVRLINISLASDRPNKILNSVFEQTATKGVLAFAAAGNNGPRAPPVYPASLKKVVAVTAVDAASRVYKQANQGPYIDFAAPGVDIWVAQNGNGGAYKSGTSYAVPFAIAVAAQSLSKNPSLSYDLMNEYLKKSAIDLGVGGRDKIYGRGLVQAQNDCENK